MSNTLDQRYNPTEVELESVEDALAELKARHAGLKTRLGSRFRALLPGANREFSAWRALSAEYGPNEPITQAINHRK